MPVRYFTITIFIKYTGYPESPPTNENVELWRNADVQSAIANMIFSL